MKRKEGSSVKRGTRNKKVPDRCKIKKSKRNAGQRGYRRSLRRKAVAKSETNLKQPMGKKFAQRDLKIVAEGEQPYLTKKGEKNRRNQMMKIYRKSKGGKKENRKINNWRGNYGRKESPRNIP